MTPAAGGASAAITTRGRGRTVLVLTYQRLSSSGAYRDVHQGRGRPVALSVPVIVRR